MTSSVHLPPCLLRHLTQRRNIKQTRPPRLQSDPRRSTPPCRQASGSEPGQTKAMASTDHRPGALWEDITSSTHSSPHIHTSSHHTRLQTVTANVFLHSSPAQRFTFHLGFFICFIFPQSLVVQTGTGVSGSQRSFKAPNTPRLTVSHCPRLPLTLKHVSAVASSNNSPPHPPSDWGIT